MFFVVMLPWVVGLFLWGLVACMFFLAAAIFLVVGIILLPFRVGFGIVNFAVQILLLPITMLTGRRWR